MTRAYQGLNAPSPETAPGTTKKRGQPENGARFAEQLEVNIKVWRRVVAGHLSKGLFAAAFLSITIVALGACDPPRPTPESANSGAKEVSQLSPSLIGKRVTIRGKFSLWGKIGPYVFLDNKQAVYLVHKGSFTWGKPYSDMEGKLVAATGTLRFYHAPPAEPTDLPAARLPDYFYFEAETARLRLIDQ